mgnify:FL=1
MRHLITWRCLASLEAMRQNEHETGGCMEMKRKGVAACMAILLVCVGIVAVNVIKNPNVQEQKGRLSEN